MNNIFLFEAYEGKEEVSRPQILSPQVNASLSDNKMSEYSS